LVEATEIMRHQTRRGAVPNRRVLYDGICEVASCSNAILYRNLVIGSYTEYWVKWSAQFAANFVSFPISETPCGFQKLRRQQVRRFCSSLVCSGTPYLLRILARYPILCERVGPMIDLPMEKPDLATSINLRTHPDLVQ